MNILFSTEARRHFDPIAQHFGLACVACTQWLVQYENDKTILRINFDSTRSFELGIEIAERGVKGPPFSLAEVLRLKGIQDPVTGGGVMVRSMAVLHDALSRCAELASAHMPDLLAGHRDSFDELARFRAKECADFALSSDLRFARLAAQTAWAKRNYSEVVGALGPFESHLSPAEKKQLEYSRKRLAY